MTAGDRPRTALIACISGLVGGVIGGLLGPCLAGFFSPAEPVLADPALADPVRPVMTSGTEPGPVAAATAPSAALTGSSIGERLAALEELVASLRQLGLGNLATQARQTGARLAAGTGPVSSAEIQRFVAIGRGVARFRSLCARQERTRDSVNRILGEAGVAPGAKDGVRALLDRFFREETEFAMADRNAMDDGARRLLEEGRKQLNDSALAELRQVLPDAQARTVADQLWQGGAPGPAVGSPSGSGMQPIAPGSLRRSPGGVLPGSGRRPVAPGKKR